MDIIHVVIKAFLVVDNTSLTTYFVLLNTDADIVMLSYNKFMNGHVDIIISSIARFSMTC